MSGHRFRTAARRRTGARLAVFCASTWPLWDAGLAGAAQRTVLGEEFTNKW